MEKLTFKEAIAALDFAMLELRLSNQHIKTGEKYIFKEAKVARLYESLERIRLVFEVLGEEDFARWVERARKHLHYINNLQNLWS